MLRHSNKRRTISVNTLILIFSTILWRRNFTKLRDLLLVTFVRSQERYDIRHISRSYLAHLSYRYKVYHGHSNSHINRDAFKHKKLYCLHETKHCVTKPPTLDVSLHLCDKIVNTCGTFLDLLSDGVHLQFLCI